MKEITITVPLTLAQRELILDAISIWRSLSKMPAVDYTPDALDTYEQAADQLEGLLGPVPAK